MVQDGTLTLQLSATKEKNAWSHACTEGFIFLCWLYLSLVHPILKNACQVWDPYTQRNIKELESVKKKFALMVSSHYRNIDYEVHCPSMSCLFQSK